MKATRRKNPTKAELLAESADKALAASAQQRNVIRLDKMERSMALGLQAREREIRATVWNPFNEDLDLFLQSLELRHGVDMRKTHGFNWRTLEIEPLPESAPPPQEPPPSTEQPEASPTIN